MDLVDVELGPCSVLFGGFDHGFDERHAADAIFDSRIIERGIVLGQLAALDPGADVIGEVFVDVGERLEVTLGMRGRRSAGAPGGGAQVTVGRAINLHGLIEPFHEERVGCFLVPLDAAQLAVNPDVEVVFFANGNLRTMKDTLGAAGETEQDVGVVVEFAALDKTGEVGGEFADLEAGDVFGEIFGVSPDVTDATAGAGSFWIGAPAGLFLAGGLETCREPALGIFDDDFPDFSELAIPARSREASGRIGRLKRTKP